MTDDRIRGVLLYALAGAVLLGGGVWFVRAAPGAPGSGTSWQAAVERILPDRESQAMAETMVLEQAATAEREEPVDGGSYTLTMVCAGVGQVRVWLSEVPGVDSGRAVPCSAEPSPDQIRVGLAGEFYLRVGAEGGDGRGAVFRWRLERDRAF